MKSLGPFYLVLGLILLCGCEAVVDRMHERFATVPPKTKVLQAPSHDVFYAAQGTLKRMGFQLSRAAEAQGIIDAFSHVRPGDGPRELRQYTAEIRLISLRSGETELSILLREQVEGLLASGAGATDLPLRDHGLYETFFAALRKALAENASGPHAAGNPR
jgi:hypothetical protein